MQFYTNFNKLDLLIRPDCRRSDGKVLYKIMFLDNVLLIRYKPK